jgi:transcription elongation factor GreA
MHIFVIRKGSSVLGFFLFYLNLKIKAMSKVIYLSEEGFNKLKNELDHLKNIERPSVIQQIAEARDKGDLSENAEYDAAKEAQGMLEMRIAKLEDSFANARVMDESKINTDTVQILNKVKIKNLKTNSTMQYVLVSESEANLREGKISTGTPIAKALLGKKVGDIVEVQIPAGLANFEVVEISR